jgi:two-component system, NarL family, capsular synthesis sensor histidine kinase RcsC
MIRMATELLLESEQDPNKINYVNSINSSMNVLYARVNDRNDFKLINKGMFRPQMQVFNLKDAFMEILQFFHLQALIKKQQLILKFESLVPEICCCDKQRLQQVLANLTSNAVKFSGNQSVQI